MMMWPVTSLLAHLRHPKRTNERQLPANTVGRDGNDNPVHARKAGTCRAEITRCSGIGSDAGGFTREISGSCAGAGAATTKHPERVEKYLEHIVQAIQHATQYVERFDSLRAFEKSQLEQDAVRRNIQIIGEAASRIQRQAPEFVTAHPELPWNRHAGHAQ